ncbi:predicted protein [Sclerotinia sclerotiorum 1980 UF-70]|uniref:Uncharacterized protein n=1 Tax=Sclerotinia sclerotiorum (strain ATCC 18683 / 1980 / Ss-1) TaxID=665079 RepID=A7EHJ7_SCLS1|nr:predicted protein [Sclerotinia sclerotiorum 1980 UF-70]EDO02313.1 predicted protein [Sclerotinia sclerotiorum 1980 UF-70]
MPFFWSKGVGGRRFGANVSADRHGLRRPVFRQNTFYDKSLEISIAE